MAFTFIHWTWWSRAVQGVLLGCWLCHGMEMLLVSSSILLVVRVECLQCVWARLTLPLMLAIGLFWSEWAPNCKCARSDRTVLTSAAVCLWTSLRTNFSMAKLALSASNLAAHFASVFWATLATCVWIVALSRVLPCFCAMSGSRDVSFILLVLVGRDGNATWVKSI